MQACPCGLHLLAPKSTNRGSSLCAGSPGTYRRKFSNAYASWFWPRSQPQPSIAMGREWGIGSSLTTETIPPEWRGWVAAAIPGGYFLAIIEFYLVYPPVGWRRLS